MSEDELDKSSMRDLRYAMARDRLWAVYDELDRRDAEMRRLYRGWIDTMTLRHLQRHAKLKMDAAICEWNERLACGKDSQ